jgi:hypothetical protein
MSDTDILERAKNYAAFWGEKAQGHDVVMVRELIAECERLRSGRRYGGLTVEEIDTKIVGLYATSSTHAFNKTKAEISANELREIADLWAALLARVKQIDGLQGTDNG